MKKMCATVLLLASISAPAILAGCGGGKKASTTPAASPEAGGATGGAAYGGHKSPASDAPPSPTSANPCAGK
jgi:hypothetical protein